MIDKQIKQNAGIFASRGRGPFQTQKEYELLVEGYIAGAHSRDEEIKELNGQVTLHKDRADYYHDLYMKLRNDNKDLEQALACAEDVVDIQRKELDKLRNPWHHVNDQMPKEREKIFFRENDGAMYYGWFDDRIQSFFTIAPDCTKWTVNGVTHWMPIPQVPKE